MFIGITMISCSLIYSLLICFIFFSKKRANIIETKIYTSLIILNITNLILELLCCYTVYNMKSLPFMVTEIINRCFLLTIYYWESVFTLYIYVISFKDKYNDKLNFKSKLGKKFLIFFFTMLIGIIFLPLKYHNENNMVYSYGPSANFLYVIVVIYFITWIVCYIKKHSKEKNNKYLPVLAFIFIMAVALLIRAANPGILVISSSFAFITNLMFFTVENPDSKLIKEVTLAKKTSDESNYEKTLFLFNMTQDIRNPINNINKTLNEALTSKNMDEVMEHLREIDSYNKELNSIVNSVLDISSVDARDIKVIDNVYNIKNLLKEIILINKKKAENKNLEFRFNIDKSIPEYLNGDSIKIKQILNKLLNNAIKYTNVGFISLNVTSIIKVNICRLIIYIEDSGVGFEAEEIDKVLTNKDYDIKNGKLTLSAVKKMLNIIGGTLVLNSKYNEGSKFTIVLDQKIDNSLKSNEQKVIEKYKDLIKEDKKVLLVDDNESSIKLISKISGHLNLKIESVMSGKECLDKIRNKEKYDLILIDEEMPKLSGYDTIKKLKMINNFNTPVIMLTKNSNLEFSNIHLEYGFTDLLIKPVTKESLANIYEKYLK